MIAFSSFFENLPWKKKNTHSDFYIVTLNNVNTEALQWVINFCYTGRIGKIIFLINFIDLVHLNLFLICEGLKESTVENILDVAGYLEVNDLVDICFEYYYKNMNSSNSIKIAELSYLYNKTDIWKNSFAYSLDHFSEVCILIYLFIDATVFLSIIYFSKITFRWFSQRVFFQLISTFF